jgi:hypothetical protein
MPMKYFSSLKIKDILSLTGLIIIGFSWIMTDQIFLKHSGERFIAFTVILILLFLVQFWIIRPTKIWQYANTISLILLIVVILLSIVMHVLIKHDFAGKIMHSILIWIVVGVMPYIAGLIYLITKK